MDIFVESPQKPPGGDPMDTGGDSNQQPQHTNPATAPGAAMQDNGGSRPFKRWVDSIRWKKASANALPERYVAGWPSEGSADEDQLKKFNTFPRLRQARPNKLSSASSSVLQTMKSASMSAASLSVMSKTQNNAKRGTQRSVCHSSGLSGSEVRMSMDSNVLTSTFTLDEAAWSRATKRRQVLQEIHVTEASYVAGLKALANVLSTILPSRASIQRNVLKIQHMHELFLLELRSVIPELGERPVTNIRSFMSRDQYARRGGLDLARLRKSDNRHSSSRNLLGTVDSRIRHSRSLAAEPSEAADVARIMNNLLPEFVAYEEYCEKYELMTEDVSLLCKSISTWPVFDMGIEALSKSVASINNRREEGNTCFTLKDLLMKPIQRICKYPLLLADLLKITPAADCPSSHGEIDRALNNLRVVVGEINRVTGDPLSRDRIRKTLLLRDRIDSPDRAPKLDVFRELGPIKLCGVLHVSYQTSSNVVGDYMMCTLFNSHLLIAMPLEDGRRFSIAACLHLAELRIESSDNRKGLHCHGVPYSWKVVFESNMHLFELVLTACSEKEEVQWKENLLKQADISRHRPSELLPDPKRCFMTTLELKPLGTMVGQPNNPARRSSIHGSLTMTMCPEVVHLVIKGTRAPPNPSQPSRPEEPGVSRSQSLMITDRTAILAPKRQDRIRIERSLADIWTRDVLPYPGMSQGKGDHPIRTSAESLMRRLSLHPAFSRRSSSLATTVTLRSVETAVCDIKADDGWEEKDGIEIILPPDGMEHKDDMEEGVGSPWSTSPTTTTSSAGRWGRKQRVYDVIEEVSNKTGATIEVKPERHHYLKKRWSASMILLKTFSTGRNRRSLSPRA
ncbi:hypothetical protein FQN54_004575 [Arachnomyces sp. PD_36]|nr:hypothetical protein FQN54_004575 [Arachnomyces sp. PD_36]